MKTVEYLAMRFTVFTDDFCFVRYNAAIILADCGEEVEAMNPGVALDDKMFFASIVEVIPEETPDSVPLQLIHGGNYLMCRWSDVDICFIPADGRI